MPSTSGASCCSNSVMQVAATRRLLLEGNLPLQCSVRHQGTHLHKGQGLHQLYQDVPRWCNHCFAVQHHPHPYSWLAATRLAFAASWIPKTHRRRASRHFGKLCDEYWQANPDGTPSPTACAIILTCQALQLAGSASAWAPWSRAEVPPLCGVL